MLVSRGNQGEDIVAYRRQQRIGSSEFIRAYVAGHELRPQDAALVGRGTVGRGGACESRAGRGDRHCLRRATIVLQGAQARIRRFREGWPTSAVGYPS